MPFMPVSWITLPFCFRYHAYKVGTTSSTPKFGLGIAVPLEVDLKVIPNSLRLGAMGEARMGIELP